MFNIYLDSIAKTFLILTPLVLVRKLLKKKKNTYIFPWHNRKLTSIDNIFITYFKYTLTNIP